jgi:hypothetical protein
VVLIGDALEQIRMLIDRKRLGCSSSMMTGSPLDRSHQTGESHFAARFGEIHGRMFASPQ